MRAWRVRPPVGEVQVLCDEETPDALCNPPHVGVVATGQVLHGYRVDVVPERPQLVDEPLGQISSI